MRINMGMGMQRGANHAESVGAIADEIDRIALHVDEQITEC